MQTKPPIYQRERLELEDGDFLDVDFVENNNQKAVILCHGLEGASTRTYNNTSAAYFLENDYSVFAWNNRSCSGEMNRLLRMYHHASVEDLDEIVQFVLEKGYQEVYLLGFSMGAAQIMNYFSRMKVNPKVKAGVAVSVPIQVRDSAEKLKMGFNRVYLKNFLYKINKKLKQKEEQFPEELNWSKLRNSKSFDEIDDYYTAPSHGFSDRFDYYKKASPAYSMDAIKTPVLVLNALDDPFLGENCYPKDFAAQHPYVFLEISAYGGHCAFPDKIKGLSYSEIRALEFFQEIK
ncbi:MAG: alpha/beta fold hydrolase [Weeksellaceae bacterium]